MSSVAEFGRGLEIAVSSVKMRWRVTIENILIKIP